MFSEDTDLTPVSYYNPNCGALRRAIIDQYPFPTGLSLFHGQAIVHSAMIQQQGITIWRQPRARGRHPLPTFLPMCYRFLMMGHDSVQLARLLPAERGLSYRDGSRTARRRSRVEAFLARFREVMARDSRYWLYLPLALPLIAIFSGCYVVARTLTALSPERAGNWLGIQFSPSDQVRQLEEGTLIPEMTRPKL